MVKTWHTNLEVVGFEPKGSHFVQIMSKFTSVSMGTKPDIL